MVLTRAQTCRAAGAACTTDEQCSVDSVCRNGSCARHTSRWRFEVLADLALGYSGHWKGSSEEWFGTDLGLGFTARFLKGMSLRWDWGMYLGYLSIGGGRDFTDPMDNATRYTIVNQVFRVGGLGRIALLTGPRLRMGFAWEIGALLFQGAAPGGLEGAFDFFVDVPATSGDHRLVVTASIGCRGSVAYRDESPNLYGVEYQTETWMVSPMLRIGAGFER